MKQNTEHGLLATRAQKLRGNTLMDGYLDINYKSIKDKNSPSKNMFYNFLKIMEHLEGDL